MFLGTAVCLAAIFAADAAPLGGTAPLVADGDIPMRMVAGIDAYLDRALDESVAKRAALWHRDFSSPAAYTESVEPNRRHLAAIIGATDLRDTPHLETIGAPSMPTVGGNPNTPVYAVRWNVFRNVSGEGLLIEPRNTLRAQIILIPDCDTSPEEFIGLTEGSFEHNQVPLILAGLGCRVIVPTLISRSDEYSGTKDVRMTNQPHREFVYRTGYELGRHPIGYDVQKVLAAVDWMDSQRGDLPIGVMGYGEGGLIGMYAAALDTRIEVNAVYGYFGPREKLWAEPIYRSVWSLLYEFGDAEIASLIAPRPLFIVANAQPDISGPPAPHDGKSGAAPGAISTPPVEAVRREVDRAKSLVNELKPTPRIVLAETQERGINNRQQALDFLEALTGTTAEVDSLLVPKPACTYTIDAAARMKRQVQQLVDDTQYLMHQAEFRRKEFWSKADTSSPEAWAKSVEWYRRYFNEEAIGALPAIESPPDARTRQVYDEPAYRGYEVMLDVLPDVFAYGILLVPKDIRPGEKRPVVVCQHGLEGRVQEVADPAQDSHYYHRFACKLAEQGFVAYAPQNPYIGEDKFRVLQRKANPLKLSLFSFIVRQHEQTLKWLGSLPFADAKRIGFYGLSYGGKTAMRVPALLDGYRLSICSGDYNEWLWKCADVSHPLTYVFTGEYEMWEWNMGNTFNHAEMSWLIYPRPFMVERGHHDGVGYDDWVAYEFARTKRHYVLLGAGDDARIEYFNGPHEIHGVGTFAFLHEKLDWPGQ